VVCASLNKVKHPDVPLTDAADLTPQAVRNVLEDLRVHQIELEMQNDELRRTQVALEAAQERYFDFYDLAPVGYVTVNEQAKILQANLAAATLLGVDRAALPGKALSAFMLEPDADRYYLLCNEAFASGSAQSCELPLLKPGNDTVWINLQAIAATGEDGVKVVRIVLIDITARKKAEALELANAQFRNAILDSVPSQIAVLDRFGTSVAVNEAWREFARTNGTEPGVVPACTNIGANYLNACRAEGEGAPSDNAALARDGILSVINGTASIFQVVYPCHSPTQERWFSMAVTPLNIENHSVVVTHTDITESKRGAELVVSHQQFRALVAFNTTAMENERKHIAREVHDELGQVLTALRMGLSVMAMHFGPLDPALIKQLDDMKVLIDRAIQGVRNVAARLRPIALERGLTVAIESLCNEFTKRSATACAFSTQLDSIAIDESRAVEIYRIVQESLTNATRYAQASEVQVTMGCDGNTLGLEVRDNGRGFIVPDESQGKTFGLLGMRERAIALGGRTDVLSVPGQGTVIAVTVPLRITTSGDAT
jgi:PAS domain S-box-containing protein